MRQTAARVSATEVRNCTLIRVEGEINETFDPSAIAGRRGVVVFDLGGVKRITSHGVLQWITALRGLHASYYCFINCRPSTMDQFNMVQAFPQRGELVSFYATFVCSECEQEMEQIIDLRHHLELHASLSLPAVTCTKCGAEAEFDEVPELYFKYVLSAPTPRPPVAVNAIIGGEQPSSAARNRRFELKKEVDQSLTAFWLSGYLDQAAYFKRAADGVEGPAVLEMAEVDGVSEGATDALKKFLNQLDDGAVLARVSPGSIEALGRVFSGRKTPKARVVSFLVPLRCMGCETTFGADIASANLATLVGRSEAFEVCPHCMHMLEPQLTTELAAAASTLPLGTASPTVGDYLRLHPPRGRIVGTDRMTTAVDPARLLLGKYHVLRRLGQGGMGEVFLARHIGAGQFERLVVLKRVRRDRLGDPQSRELFLKEARIAARLSHRSIVQIFDLEKIDDEFLISMEYVNGIDLARALQLSREQRLIWPVEICCRVIAELCDALRAAHTYHDAEGRPSPIVHRDVSPSNILLSTDGAVKLADFGIARATADPNDAATMRGKAGYAAPEQWAGANGDVGAWTDIYAVGVVLFECVTLRPISFGPTAQPRDATMHRMQQQSPPQICVARSGVPPLLQDVFERAIQIEPRNRYRSAHELGRDVERIGRLVAETTSDDLALWIRRLVALRLEADGYQAAPIVTMNTGSGQPAASSSGPHRLSDYPEFTRK